MPKKMGSDSVTKIFAIILCLAAIAVLILQVVLAGEKATQLETALFSTLLFVLSLGFAWVLSRTSFRREFMEAQRTFAIAAYRRVCEIDRGVQRLISRTGARLPGSSDQLRHEHEVTMAIALGVRQAARSSIADWADIIGDEITTMQRIEEISDEQDRLFVSPPVEKGESGASFKAVAPALSERFGVLEDQIDQLRASLPPSLQVIARKDRADSERVRFDSKWSALEAQMSEDGHLELEGFWEDHQGFEDCIRNCMAGEVVQVTVGDVGSRIGALIVRRASGASVGVIYNDSNSSPSMYHTFAHALCNVVGASTFDAIITHVDTRLEHERMHFRVKIEPGSHDR